MSLKELVPLNNGLSDQKLSHIISEEIENNSRVTLDPIFSFGNFVGNINVRNPDYIRKGQHDIHWLNGIH
jgi:hypothetical protein